MPNLPTLASLAADLDSGATTSRRRTMPVAELFGLVPVLAVGPVAVGPEVPPAVAPEVAPPVDC